MTARPFPQEWFTPTPEAHRAAAALAEGLCPFPQCGDPLDRAGYCPAYEVNWELIPAGFCGCVHSPGGSAALSVYPFAGPGTPET